jgi:hypothetical protein
VLRDQNRALIKLVAGLRGQLGAVIAAFQENTGVLVDVDVRRI